MMRSNIGRWVSVVLPSCLGLAVTVTAFVIASSRQRERIKLEFHRQTEVLNSALRRRLDAYMEVVYAVASLYDSSVEVTREEFKTFVGRYLARRPGIQALGWVPRVPVAEREAFEQAVRSELPAETEFAIRQWSDGRWQALEADGTDEFFPVLYIEPLEDNLPLLACDLASRPVCQEAMQRARKTAEAAATACTQLVPSGRHERYVMTFLPVYAKRAEGELTGQLQPKLDGFVLGLYRAKVIIESSLQHLDRRDIVLQIIDHSVGPDSQSVIYGSPPGEFRPRLQRMIRHQVGGRDWEIRFGATPDYLRQRADWGPYGVLVGGLLLTAMLAGLLLQMSGRAKRIAELVDRRTEELRRANASLQASQQKLAQVASKLALPPQQMHPESRPVSINRCTLADLLACGAAIRGMSGQCQNRTQVGQKLVTYLYEQLRGYEEQRALALVRLFETRRYDELDQELQALCRQVVDHPAPDMRCLVLTASAGQQPEWNDPAQSTGHRVIPLPSREAAERLPMISQLIKQLGLDVEGVLAPDRALLVSTTGSGVFHVEQALGSPYIPAQEQFVVPYGIRSVVGFGDLLPDGSMFAVVAFAKVAISRDKAQLFSHLANSTKMALLAFVDAENKIEAQIVALDQLLRSHEAIVIQQESELRATLEQLARSNEELKRSEQLLAQQADQLARYNRQLIERNKDLDAFAYSASHDLQAPLRRTKSFSQLLQRRYRGQLDREADELIDFIVQSTEQMQQLVDALLQYARAGTQQPKLEPVDCEEVVDQVLRNLADAIQECNAHITRDALPTVQADRIQMIQLMQNLIGNAIKYRGDETPQVQISAREEADQVVFSVQDNGIGIDPKYADQIFMIFKRLHGDSEYSGSGIGLATCKKIVTRHGGRIWVQSEPGRGSTFYFTIPRKPPRQGES